MGSPLSRKWSWAIGLVLSFVCLVYAIYYYLSTHKINLHITSRVFMLVLVLVIVIVFFVLPVYSVIVTNEIRKRRRVESALIRAKEDAEFFNLLNRANPAAVNGLPPSSPSSTAPKFAQVLQVLPGREGQVGLRLEF
jgi:hypothetical protein